MGHARALLALERAEQILAANQVVEKRLSVRETERLVVQQQAQQSQSGSGSGTGRRPVDADLQRLQEQIAEHLQAVVELQANARGKGRLVIRFDSAEQFEGLRSAMGLGADRIGD
jgi:ParB family chromosome partitioning protein